MYLPLVWYTAFCMTVMYMLDNGYMSTFINQFTPYLNAPYWTHNSHLITTYRHELHWCEKKNYYEIICENFELNIFVDNFEGMYLPKMLSQQVVVVRCCSCIKKYMAFSKQRFSHAHKKICMNREGGIHSIITCIHFERITVYKFCRSLCQNVCIEWLHR